MRSPKSERYWRAMFEGETGDIVKNILTDGQWAPSKPYGKEYEPDTIAVEIVGTIFAVIIIVVVVGVVVFGAWKFLPWIW